MGLFFGGANGANGGTMDETPKNCVGQFVKVAQEAVEKASNATSIEETVRQLDLADQLLTAALEAIATTPKSN